MNEWVQQIEDHAFFADLNNLKNLLQAAYENTNSDDITEKEIINRLSRIIAHVEKVIDLSDPFLLLSKWLENIRINIIQCMQNITNYINNKQISYLNNAVNYGNSILEHSAVIWQSTVKSKGDVRKTISEFSNHCSKLVIDLDKDIKNTKNSSEKLRNDVAEVQREITKQKQRIDLAISQFTQNFNDSQTSRNSDFISMKNEILAEIQSHNTEWQTTLSEITENSEQYFTKFAEDGENLITEYANKITTKNSEIINKLIEEKNQLIEKLKKDKSEAERLVGIISMTGMVGGYQQVANNERDNFLRWRKATIFSIILLVLFSLYAYLWPLSADFQAGLFANRIFVTITLFILSGYCAFQADRHRRAEIENRRMELELASFDPFLATLEESERNELKKQLADRIFGQPKANLNSKDNVSPINLLDIIKKVIEKLPSGD